ncbi:assimilatory sulfite reductase [Rickenella mellea]|uniref:assimilatory sulfite reductase (NADPH) n=1 Tax=Rickenella mellea TaxID=50990 RepID=A0A4R5XFP8_9AGAM|nr:assimilatory sulfite reductase [Rickenella mellea]
MAISPVPPAPQEVLGSTANKTQLPAFAVLEWISISTSSQIFIYDLAQQTGVGNLSLNWSQNGQTSKTVTRVETRSGAGLSLVGRLVSEDDAERQIITAYNTPTGFAAMTPSLSFLPEPTPRRRLVIHVPAVSPIEPALTLSPTLASLTPFLHTVPPYVAVFLSATPQETVELAMLAYMISTAHVIHVFDQHSAAREAAHIVNQPLPSRNDARVDVYEAFEDAGYGLYDYAGDNDASVAIVMLNGPLASIVKVLATRVTGLGVVVVRVLRPWNDAAFFASIPDTVKAVHVWDDVPTNSSLRNLYADVITSFTKTSDLRPIVHGHRIVPAQTQEYMEHPPLLTQFLSRLLPNQLTKLPSVDEERNDVKKLMFFGTTANTLSAVPQLVLKTFSSNRAVRARLLTDHDALSNYESISASRLVLSPKRDVTDYIPIPSLIPFGNASPSADFIGVLDHTLMKTHAVAKYLKPGSPLLIITTWSSAEIISNSHPSTISLIQEKGIKMFRIDAKIAAKDIVEGKPTNLESVLAHLAFLRIYIGRPATQALVSKIATTAYKDTIDSKTMSKLAALAWLALEEVDIPAVEEIHDTALDDPKDFHFNAVDPQSFDLQKSFPARVDSWHAAAKHIIFPEAFRPLGVDGQNEQMPRQINTLRPEVTDTTFVITCAVNRRLTPLEYERNVFHVEFDTSGTGLKYAIGDALGVHGWNDADEVLEFCNWYGIDSKQLVTLPVPVGGGNQHTRTIFQALQQQIDIFGKPPKGFYSALAEHAKAKDDRLSLQFIGSPEGSSTFKKLAEKDTVTFADVLHRYNSARPAFEVLCELVGDIKPRHYSIASAQSAVGDRVDLLVVTVDWVTPSGSPRYGQCTRFLAGLKPGQQTTVSIKPSVMKLPPDNMQPIILAGLGTGAAPFRAFWQHRAWLASQGIPIGPLYYYFGSRHRSEEYLYGEEIEAYILDKIITHLGLAFSRDQKKKIYIQNRMQEDAETLVKMLYEEKGVFYLCGPTWPVPDVYETLVGALTKYVGLEPTVAGDYLEGLKEEERYVLEVY